MVDLHSQAFYEAAFDDAAPHRLAELVSAAFGGRSAILHWMSGDAPPEVLSHTYFDQEVIEGFKAHAHDDPWTARGGQLPRGRPVRLSRFVPVESYQSSGFYNDFVRKIGDDTSYCMGLVQPSQDGLAVLALHRGARQGDFAIEDEQRLAVFSAELSTILATRTRLSHAERKAARLERTLDAAQKAVIHVMQDHRVTFANEPAQKLFRQADVLQLRRGHILAAGNEGGAFARAVDEALRHGRGGALRLAKPDGRLAYQATVSPLYSAPLRSTVALVLVHDPESKSPVLVQEYMAYFGLTQAEAEISSGLAQGLDPEGVAEARGVAVATVRTLLKRAMDKTGTHRQSELVSLLLKSPRIQR